MTSDNQPGPYQYGPPPGEPVPAPPPPAAKPRRRWVWPTVGATAALIVGIAIGSSGDEPEPAAGQTGETVTVAEVPAACLDALAEAEQLMDISADFASVAAEFPPMIAEGIEAGMAYDVAAVEDLTARIEASTGDIETLTAQVNGSSYGDDAAGCRDAAGE